VDADSDVLGTGRRMTRTHRVLIVGVGSIGQRHLRCFQQTGRAHVAICEIQAEARDEAARRYGVQSVYADLDAALPADHDAAVICTPAHRQLPLATRLAEAGVAVLIEKPLGVGLEHVDPFRRIVQRNGLAVAVGYVLRAHPVIADMRRAIQTGRFGQPHELTAVCGQDFPSFRPAYRDIYYARRETGGGAIQDAMAHVVNLGQWLLGPVDRLVADAAHQKLPGVEVEDTVHVIARHGRVLAQYALNQYQAPNEVTVTVVCDQGTVRLEMYRHRWRWMTQANGQWQDETYPDQPRDALFIRQAHHFLDVVENKGAPLCTLDEAEHTLRTNLAILRSVAQRNWQDVGHY